MYVSCLPTTHCSRPDTSAESACRSPPAALGGDERIEAERIELLFRNGRASDLFVLVAALLFVVLLEAEIAPEIRFAWLAFMLIGGGARLALVVWRQRSPDSASSARWALRYTLATAWLGVGWACLIIGTAGDLALSPLTILAVLGVCALAVPLLASHRFALYLHTLPALAAMACSLLLAGDPASLLLVVLVALFGLLLLHSGAIFNALLLNSLRQRREHETMAGELNAQRDMAKDLARQLRDEVEQRRAAEGVLAAQRANLEAVVAQHTRELTLSKEFAEAARRAQSRLLADMSYELRRPMNDILSMSELALCRATDAAQIEELNEAMHESRHLLELIDDIVDWSQIEAEHLTLANVDFRLGELVEQLGALLAARARENRVVLRIDADPVVSDCRLRGDPQRLGQILSTLTGNAVRFSRHRSVSVGVGVGEESAQSVRLRCAVADVGIGVPLDESGRCLTGFGQANASLPRRYHGAELGLATCTRLVGLMNGEIGVASRPDDEASIFWFTVRLPRSVQTASEPGGPVRALARDALMAQHRGRVILLAEDEPLNQIVCREILEDAGLSVAIAPDGECALRMAGAAKYDLILMDVRMPKLDGLAATRAIRQLPAMARVPIVAVTASAFAGDRQRCLAAGMNDFVAKPLVPGVLCATILAWLDRPCG
ncbi:MAG TPA: response regulator [Accumulibacter sp.]|uniref:response regulator n=1 Tax=Accumulibacter sp. TaxID=2053492 RepID=UPI002C051C0C|nr:response regulator [Accumulibacter sp.]HNL96617.1 response regulator [Accumulibacter sp.]